MSRFSQFIITGVVQGVGFRPFIHQACTKAGMHGYVQNIGNGVIIVTDDESSLRDILTHIPEHIRIDSITVKDVDEYYSDFRIRGSDGSGNAEIPPDLFLCPDCLGELSDPDNRRYGYFFTTCTHCGPRFTIACESPYDRHTTTMKDFPLCPDCEREYSDPTDRRFHAQTIACHSCGPKLSLFEHESLVPTKNDGEKLMRVADALRSGSIVAIKGIGGFHLFCKPDIEAIDQLNQLTRRKGKPYALLCRDLAMARTIADITPEEEALLISPARPIVLLKKQASSPAASELDTVGIMLAYTALHMLLFDHIDSPLICTSSNRSGAPITLRRDDQFAPIVLDHNRSIRNAADDSVVKVIGKRPFLIRRSRGLVPQSIDIRSSDPSPVLALGAERNSTFALYDGAGRVTLSGHLGDTSHPDTLRRYQDTVQGFLKTTGIIPEAILCDAHPAYETSLYGIELARQFDIPLVKIQHHRAHAFAVAQEHQLIDFAAIVCDGLGYGDDGTIWGGEVFENDIRIGHLEQHPQLGGDSANHSPLKMLYSLLRSFLPPEDAASFIASKFSSAEISILEKQLAERFNAPLTSSCGRVLDAAAALLGIYDENTYDGRGAMLLESISTEPYRLTPEIDGSILHTAPLFAYLIRHRSLDRGRLAATVQQYLAEGLYRIAEQRKKPIVWAGGCAYNRIMTEYFLSKGVLTNIAVPPGDGGISFGQIAAYLASKKTRSAL